jgi:hypothetical protein
MAEQKDITKNNMGVKVNKELVKKLNQQAVPDKFDVKKKWFPNVDIREISIGNPNPVMGFKEWSKNSFSKVDKTKKSD